MACYHPLIRATSPTQLEKNTTKPGYHKKYWVYNSNNEEMHRMIQEMGGEEEPIPCGNCIGCRLEYSREWANRGYLESKLWKQNWFVTLTYSDDFLFIPENVNLNGSIYPKQENWKGCLIPDHVTQFMKNLRKIMKEEHENENIRFMACGEYGGEGERPHYHLIIFNLNLPLNDLYAPRIINKNVYYQSHIIERAWGEKWQNGVKTKEKKGICNVSEATWNDIAYTARYITKKINGSESMEQYDEKGQIKEFFRVSRMPGIGQGYFEKHWKEIYKNDEIIIKNMAGSVKTQPPKYFDELLKQKDKYKYLTIKAERKRRSKEHNYIKYENTSQMPLDQLAIEERTHEEKHLKLIRAMEQNVD